jgi:hypothetical protein
MVTDEVIAEERPVATYAQPLSRLQVSWGSILAGAVALGAVSLIVWALALAIIVTSMSASVNALKGAIIAGWVCAIATTLIGAFVGGMVAGYLPGNPRRLVTVTHGFLAWAVAFLVSAVLHGAMIEGVVRGTAATAAATATAAVQTAGSAVGGAAGSPATLDQKATGLLEALGYPPAEAAGMVASARGNVQQILRGEGPASQQVKQGAAQAGERVRGALDTLLGYFALYAWLWWGTWVVACGLSMLGALMVVGRTRKVPELERARGSEPLHVATLRPVRTTP